MRSRFRNKTLAVFLAFTVGSTGAHRFYLVGHRSRTALLYLIGFLLLFGFGLDHSLEDPAFGLHMPYDLFRPAMLLAALPAVVAMLDAILIALTPDERFDQQFNSHTDAKNHSGGLAVTFAAISLAVGAGLMVIMLAVDLEAAVEALPHQALDQSAPVH